MSVDIWKDIVGDNGPRLLGEILVDIEREFAAAASAPNHAVREAACWCISELAQKVYPVMPDGFTRHRVVLFLNILINLMRDASWPVRECALSAAALFAEQFPEWSLPLSDLLFDLTIDEFSDNIPAVRKSAAKSCAKLLFLYKNKKNEILSILKIGLTAVKYQEYDSPNFVQYMPSGPFSIPSARRIDSTFETDFTEQDMFSCGSLTSKYHNETSNETSDKNIINDNIRYTTDGKMRILNDPGGGCMKSCTNLHRKRQPWEITQSCIFLLVNIITDETDDNETVKKNILSNKYETVENIVTDVDETVKEKNILSNIYNSKIKNIWGGIIPSKIENKDFVDLLIDCYTADKYRQVDVLRESICDAFEIMKPFLEESQLSKIKTTLGGEGFR
eukprot:GHVL01041404.1.p1 GENE.GHVL01041404.1~~GHVL01041404.1.p1  ORF type:complete len:391 (+),score=127.02 GHVL01041404.1:789-1961(+)